MTETYGVAVSDIADTYLIMSHGLYVLQGVASFPDQFSHTGSNQKLMACFSIWVCSNFQTPESEFNSHTDLLEACQRDQGISFNLVVMCAYLNTFPACCEV